MCAHRPLKLLPVWLDDFTSSFYRKNWASDNSLVLQQLTIGSWLLSPLVKLTAPHREYALSRHLKAIYNWPHVHPFTHTPMEAASTPGPAHPIDSDDEVSNLYKSSMHTDLKHWGSWYKKITSSQLAACCLGSRSQRNAEGTKLTGSEEVFVACRW